MRREPGAATSAGRRSREARIRRALLAWYDRVARPLPWRRSTDSYRVWVAEVMLQQTRIAVVIPAYERFLGAFPTIAALARAEEEDVLSLWSGLGYYSRARSLHRAARVLHERGETAFPFEREEALALPGVGEYTAAAVLSIAHGKPWAAVDGNVIRVLSRLDCLPRPDARGAPHAEIASRLLARDRPGDWNQALMELGEMVCTPKAPACDACPLAEPCEARRRDVVLLHPPPKPRRGTERLGLELTVVRDRAGRLLLERGAFAHLDHLWLPPVRLLPSPPARTDFRHAILHRAFDVAVKERVLGSEALRALATKPLRNGIERRVVAASDLDRLGRSSLLTKALRLLGA